MVEGGAAALAAERATPAQIDELERLARQMEDTADYEPWSASDTLFHLLIADASGSQRLVSRVAELRSEVYRVTRHVPTPRGTVELADREHREILKALRAGRVERARTAMVRHVESTRALWLGLGRVS